MLQDSFSSKKQNDKDILIITQYKTSKDNLIQYKKIENKSEKTYKNSPKFYYKKTKPQDNQQHSQGLIPSQNQHYSKKNKINRLNVQFKSKSQPLNMQIDNQTDTQGYLKRQIESSFEISQPKQPSASQSFNNIYKKNLLILKSKQIVPQNWKIKFNSYLANKYTNHILKKPTFKKRINQQDNQRINKLKLALSSVKSQVINQGAKSKNKIKNILNRSDSFLTTYHDMQKSHKNVINSSYSTIKLDLKLESPYLKNYLKTTSSKALKVKSISRFDNYFQRLFKQKSQNNKQNYNSLDYHQSSFDINTLKQFQIKIKQKTSAISSFAQRKKYGDSQNTFKKQKNIQKKSFRKQQSINKQQINQVKFNSHKLTIKLQPWTTQLQQPFAIQF